MPTKITISSLDNISNDDIKLIQASFNEIPLKEILIGLKFATNRWHAKDAGILKAVSYTHLTLPTKRIV